MNPMQYMAAAHVKRTSITVIFKEVYLQQLLLNPYYAKSTWFFPTFYYLILINTIFYTLSKPER